MAFYLPALVFDDIRDLVTNQSTEIKSAVDLANSSGVTFYSILVDGLPSANSFYTTLNKFVSPSNDLDNVQLDIDTIYSNIYSTYLSTLEAHVQANGFTDLNAYVSGMGVSHYVTSQFADVCSACDIDLTSGLGGCVL